MDCLYLKKLKREKGSKDSKKFIKVHTDWGDLNLEVFDIDELNDALAPHDNAVAAEPHEENERVEPQENVRVEPQEAEEIHMGNGILAQLERMRELERAMEPVRYEPVRIEEPWNWQGAGQNAWFNV